MSLEGAGVADAGHSHTAHLPDGRKLVFDTVWDGLGEELRSVVVWTHDLPDAEVLLRARAYLEGPFRLAYDDPYELVDGSSMPRAQDFWPAPDGNLAERISRIWARWHVVADGEAGQGEYEYRDPGDWVWVGSTEPGEGLRPVTVVELGQS